MNIGNVLGATGLALVGGCSTPDFNGRHQWGSEAGVFFSYHFGHGSEVGFAAGLEARRIYFLPCPNAPTRFGGAVARAMYLGANQGRLLVGPLLGNTTQVTQVSGELALGYDLGGSAPGVVVQPGLDGTFLPLGAKLGYAVGRDVSVGAGLRFPFPMCVVEGRPLRRDEGALAAPAIRLAGGARDCDELDSGVRIWLQRAAAEWASVPAFLELADQLRVSGAPESFRVRALTAAEDEVRHALAAASVAAQLTGRVVIVDSAAPDRRTAATGVQGLRRLATESWIDGCLGEGLAARHAAAEAEAATPGSLRRSRQVVAEEEARHAELAWDILAWTSSVGGPGVRQAVDETDRVLTRLGTARQDRPDEQPASFLPRATMRDLHERHRATAVSRRERLG